MDLTAGTAGNFSCPNAADSANPTTLPEPEPAPEPSDASDQDDAAVISDTTTPPKKKRKKEDARYTGKTNEVGFQGLMHVFSVYVL